MFVVFDIDGTLANAEHRIHHLNEPKNWQAFLDASGGDTAFPEMTFLLDVITEAGVRVEFWTGRDEKYRKLTEDWIAQHLNYVDVSLRMRPLGDRRPDWEVKREMIKLHGKPDIVFEDRSQVVKMWREEGIRCLQVCDGDY